MSKNIDGWSDTTMPMKQEVYIDKEGGGALKWQMVCLVCTIWR
jgi:hypothetical protein